MPDTESSLIPNAVTRAQADPPRRMQLVIANKNYSSWSMRPWVALTAFNIPFEEIRVGLAESDTEQQILRYSPTGRVPVLIADGLTIWDSLAICEYVAERFPAHPMWPQDSRARAVARAVCAEMHAGFAALRSDMSMNIRASRAGKGRTPDALADIARICAIWEQCLADYGQSKFLFGGFSIADAFYAPVVMRLLTYQVALAPALQDYADRVAAHPAVARWITQALAEPQAIARYDDAQ